MGYNNFKQNSIETFGYIAKNRLTSGFLSVNVVHTETGNDDTNDWKHLWEANGEAQNPGLDGAGRRPTNFCKNNEVPDPGDLNKRIADYSCHIFYVVVGCTWNQARVPQWQDWYINPTGDPSPGYYSGFDPACGAERNTTRPHPDHCFCQSFVRAYPLGLINPDTGTLVNHQTFTVDGKHGVIRSKLGNAKNTGTPWVEDGNNISFADWWEWSQIAAQFGAHNGLGSPYKQPTGTKLNYTAQNHEYVHDYGFSMPPYSENTDPLIAQQNPHTGPESGFPDLAFNRVNPRTGGNNTGLLPNYGNGYISGGYGHPTPIQDATFDWNDEDSDNVSELNSGWDDTTTGDNDADNVNQNSIGDMNTLKDINKSFKNPVRGITIEGWHDFEYKDRYSGSAQDEGYGKWHYDGADWTSPQGSFAVTRHSPFALRVGIDLLNDGWERITHPEGGSMGPGVLGPTKHSLGDTSAADSNPYEQTYGLGNRQVSVNVSFTPMGETNSITFKKDPPSDSEDSNGNPA